MTPVPAPESDSVGDDEPLHIAILTPWETKGGISTYSARLVDALRDRDDNVSVTSVPLRAPHSSNPVEFLRVVRDIPVEAEIVHIQFEAGVYGRLGISGVWAPPLFALLAYDDRPVVTTLHEVFDEHADVGPVGSRILRVRDTVIERSALRGSAAVVVHTRAAKQTLKGRYGSDHRVERMLHPVETADSCIPAKDAKAELDFEGPVILTFGWIEPKKRYGDVLRALTELPEVTYLIAGEPRTEDDEDLLEDVFQLASALGVRDRVRHIGYVEEEQVPMVFSAADAVVLPYERVTQSGAVNVALAYGRPVVCSSLPAFEELREEFECLLTYEDEAELAGRLERVLSDESLRSRLRTHAQEYAETVTWERFAELTVDVYRDVLAD